MASTMGTKEINKYWPNEEGLTLGTTKIEGKQINLVAEDGSNVSKKEKVLL